MALPSRIELEEFITLLCTAKLAIKTRKTSPQYVCYWMETVKKYCRTSSSPHFFSRLLLVFAARLSKEVNEYNADHERYLDHVNTSKNIMIKKHQYTWFLKVSAYFSEDKYALVNHHWLRDQDAVYCNLIFPVLKCSVEL